jgi:hypothetical protein
MIRSIHQLVICAALLTLLFSMSAANVQASAGPCDAGDGQVDVTVCADFLGYVRDLITSSNETIAVSIPESTMSRESARYIPDWDDNNVAYIPESTMGIHSLRYVHDWDANPVAYIPESTMDISLDEILGLQDDGK